MNFVSIRQMTNSTILFNKTVYSKDTYKSQFTHAFTYESFLIKFFKKIVVLNFTILKKSFHPKYGNKATKMHMLLSIREYE